MIDYFALYGMPRRPWLEEAAVKQRFHELAAQHHPDVEGNTDTFTQVNLGYQTLREPASRIRHLLELEYEKTPAGTPEIPQGLADRFMEVATLEREVHVFLQEQTTASSALSKSLLAGERFAIEHDIEKLLGDLQIDWSRCEQLLQAEDQLWDQRTNESALRLAVLQQEFSFVAKWLKQLRERLVQLEAAA